MKELLQTYQETVRALFERFGQKGGYGEIVVQTDAVWTTVQDEEVRWIKDGEVYCNETMHSTPYRHENWVMYWVDNGCGDRFYQIFDENLRDDSLELWD
jgi:hypothetical protein